MLFSATRSFGRWMAAGFTMFWLAPCLLAQPQDTTADAQPAPANLKGIQAAQPQPAAAPEAVDEGGCGGGSAPKAGGVQSVIAGRPQRIRPGNQPDAGPAPAAEGPHPRWACPAQTVTIEPIWAGQELRGTWIVQNTGEADLNIRLKGG